MLKDRGLPLRALELRQNVFTDGLVQSGLAIADKTYERSINGYPIIRHL